MIKTWLERKMGTSLMIGAGSALVLIDVFKLATTDVAVLTVLTGVRIAVSIAWIFGVITTILINENRIDVAFKQHERMWHAIARPASDLPQIERLNDAPSGPNERDDPSDPGSQPRT